MRPIPIPNELVWPGGVRRVISGPDGDLTGDIRGVEALLDTSALGPRFNLLITLEPGELGKLAKEPRFWLTWIGDHLHPFSLTLEADR